MIFLVNEEPVQNNRKASKNMFPKGCTVLIKKQGLTGGGRGVKSVVNTIYKDKKVGKKEVYKFKAEELTKKVSDTKYDSPVCKDGQAICNHLATAYASNPARLFSDCHKDLALENINELLELTLSMLRRSCLDTLMANPWQTEMNKSLPAKKV